MIADIAFNTLRVDYIGGNCPVLPGTSQNLNSVECPSSNLVNPCCDRWKAQNEVILHICLAFKKLLECRLVVGFLDGIAYWSGAAYVLKDLSHIDEDARNIGLTLNLKRVTLSVSQLKHRPFRYQVKFLFRTSGALPFKSLHSAYIRQLVSTSMQECEANIKTFNG